MKTTIMLAIAFLLPLTACTSTKNLQASADCHNIIKLDETANNGFYLLDPNVKEPNKSTAVIVGKPLIRFEDIERVSLYPDEHDALDIYFTIDFEKGLKLSGVTQRRISEYMALVVNDKVVNVSQIQAAIGTSFYLNRLDSNEEANQIYLKIKCYIK